MYYRLTSYTCCRRQGCSEDRNVCTWHCNLKIPVLSHNPLAFLSSMGPTVNFMAHSLTKEVLLKNNSPVLVPKWRLGLIKWGCVTWALWTMQHMVDSLLWVLSQCSLCWIGCYVYSLTESPPLEEGAVHYAQHLASGRDLLLCVSFPALFFISRINSSAVGVYAIVLWSVYA